MQAIKVNNIKYSYDKNHIVLNDVSFQINKGEYVAILGPNGCGKSTLLKLIAGLYPYKDGEIYIFDKKLDEKSINEIRKHIGIVFQNPDNQFIAQSVEDDVAFGLENRNIKREEMKDIIHSSLKKVGLENYMDVEPTMLSGGQKQRAAIAGVIALNPDILFLDEATSMLDPRSKREILELINDMRKINPDLTILSITHDVNDTLFASKVLVMNEGKIMMYDSPSKVFKEKELLKRCSLKMPLLYELKSALESKGYDTSNLDTIEDVRGMICRLK